MQGIQEMLFLHHQDHLDFLILHQYQQHQHHHRHHRHNQQGRCRHHQHHLSYHKVCSHLVLVVEEQDQVRLENQVVLHNFHLKIHLRYLF